MRKVTPLSVTRNFLGNLFSASVPGICSGTGIKKGVPLYSNLVNLKSNTMKNTMQSYGLFAYLQIIAA